jgi:hypothetical protein
LRKSSCVASPKTGFVSSLTFNIGDRLTVDRSYIWFETAN